MEYEAARTELLEEVARGASIQELQARLTKKNDAGNIHEPSHSETKKITDDLVQIQSYIRWEKAGKPNYSPEEQLVNSKSPLNILVSFLFFPHFPSRHCLTNWALTVRSLGL